MLISIDRFYSENFYNTCKEALKNNNILYSEYVSTIGTYKWYLDVPRKPFMINFEECPVSERRYLVSKVIPLDMSDEYRYYRRADSMGHFEPKYVRNDVFSSLVNSEAYLFKVKSKKQLVDLSKISRIWYLGRYYNNRYRLALTTSLACRIVIPSEDVLLEKNPDETPENFELRINYSVLNSKEKIVKFSRTPYYENGKWNVPTYYPEYAKERFMVI